MGMPKLSNDDVRAIDRVLHENGNEARVASVIALRRAVPSLSLANARDIVDADRAGKCWCGCGKARPEDVVAEIARLTMAGQEAPLVDYLESLELDEVSTMYSIFNTASMIIDRVGARRVADALGLTPEDISKIVQDVIGEATNGVSVRVVRENRNN